MKLAPRTSRLLATLMTSLLVIVLAMSSSPTSRGQAGSKTVKLPPDLLKALPFDKITLIDDTVWLIEPVARPPAPRL